MQGCAIGETANKKCKARIRVVGLPFSVTRWIEKHEFEISLLNHLVSTWTKKNSMNTLEEEIEIADKFLIEFEQKLIENQLPNKFINLIKQNLVWFGPKRWGPNILINQLIDEKYSLFKKFESMKSKLLSEDEEPAKTTNDSEIKDQSLEIQGDNQGDVAHLSEGKSLETEKETKESETVIHINKDEGSST